MGRDLTLGDEVGDAVGEHPRLAGPGSGDDKQRTTLVQHRRALLRVQPLEQGVSRRHRHVFTLGAQTDSRALARRISARAAVVPRSALPGTRD